MLVFVDTSAWYALANAADLDHARVRKALAAKGTRLLTTSFVFDEIVTLVKARQGLPPAVRVGDYLRSDEVELVPVQEEDLERAWDLFRKWRDKGCSFTDCTSFAVMGRLGLRRAVALDEDFRQAGFEVEP